MLLECLAGYTGSRSLRIIDAPVIASSRKMPALTPLAFTSVYTSEMRMKRFCGVSCDPASTHLLEFSRFWGPP